MRRQDYELLLDLLREHAGWEFDEEQYFVVDKKISNFIREKGYVSVEELITELKIGNRPLISQVVESMAFSDTSFYRDYDVFMRFEKSLLPNLRENNRARKKLRFWSLGCSSGQETYSIAFAIKRKFIGLDNWDINIVGTDISSLAISKLKINTDAPDRIAVFWAILRTKAVFPIAGLAAKIISSCGCNPLVALSKS